MLILKIAFRNILRHRGKSLVVGIILFIGSLVMIIGSATINTMNKSVKDAMVNKFLGDITILAKSQEREDVFMQLMGENADVLPQFNKVKEYLNGVEEIDAYLPYTYGLLLMLAGSDNPMGYPAICGVIGTDIKKYQEMFGNIKTLEGELPPLNTQGIFLSKYMRDMFYMFNQDVYYPTNTAFKTEYLQSNLRDSKAKDLTIKNEIILMGYSSKNSTVDVSIPILGVFEYRSLNTFWREISILDIDSYRQCMNYTLETEEKNLSKAEAKLIALDRSDIESLFSSEGMIEEITSTETFDVKSFFKKTSKNETKRDFNQGAFELISVRLKPEYKRNLSEIINKLNLAFDQNQLEVKAVSWEDTAGAIAKMIGGMRIGLYSVVMLIFVVAIIIIMNTLSMSVLERASELGMMRAIGAKKTTLSWMIIGETFFLNAIFGGLGILSGIPLILFLSFLQIPVKNEFLQIITGGAIYFPSLSLTDILVGIAMLGFVTVASVIYPVWVSQKVGPLDAVARS